MQHLSFTVTGSKDEKSLQILDSLYSKIKTQIENNSKFEFILSNRTGCAKDFSNISPGYLKNQLELFNIQETNIDPVTVYLLLIQKLSSIIDKPIYVYLSNDYWHNYENYSIRKEWIVDNNGWKLTYDNSVKEDKTEKTSNIFVTYFNKIKNLFN